MTQPAGPIVLDLLGVELDAEERELLQHPLVGGVIYFARNYVSPQQIAALSQSIKAIRPELLITVDQEGGRVQRFREGFLRIPPMGEVGELYENAPETALQLAYSIGWLIAAELLAVGVDLSFAPVLDLNKHRNTVIGDRGFAAEPQVVAKLAIAQMRGMHAAGMAATGKHFPGHGHVALDSHLALPMDERDFPTIFAEDLQPFIELIHAGIDAMMPAHILFPQVDDRPVGFSPYWLQTVLRKQLGFSGIIFSDDLNMEGSSIAGSYADRARSALSAGCDLALICNNRSGAIQILDELQSQASHHRPHVAALKAKQFYSLSTLHAEQAWNTHANLLLQHRKQYENH